MISETIGTLQLTKDKKIYAVLVCKENNKLVIRKHKCYDMPVSLSSILEFDTQHAMEGFLLNEGFEKMEYPSSSPLDVREYWKDIGTIHNNKHKISENLLNIAKQLITLAVDVSHIEYKYDYIAAKEINRLAEELKEVYNVR